MRSLLFLIALVPTMALADECRFSAQRDFDVDAAALKTLTILPESDDVQIEGVAGLAKVEVRGRACASNQAWLADLTVAQQRRGDALILTTSQPRAQQTQWFGSSHAYIQLHVRVPASLEIGIRASSGDARVRKVAALDFDSRSGDLEADAITAALTFDVGSGSVRGADIGSVVGRGTQSGDIHLRDVRGDVQLVRSGSGDLQFEHVGGGVDIGAVGSGDVSIRQVERNVVLDSIGSGDVNASDIGGDFSVRASGSGNVRHSGVRGSVSVPHDDA